MSSRPASGPASRPSSGRAGGRPSRGAARPAGGPTSRRHDDLADVQDHRARQRTGLGLAGLIVLAVVVSAVQIWVANPLAAAPAGTSLGQVYADLGAAGELSGQWFGVLMHAAGLIAAGVLAWFTVDRYEVGRPVLAVAGGMLLALSAPAYWLSSFGMGMALADTYQIGGGDHSPLSWGVYLLALVGLAVLVRELLTGLRAAAEQAR
jgi:hypothetical protein